MTGNHVTVKRYSLLILLLWELIRLSIVFISLISVVSQSLNSNRQVLYWLLSVSSFQLISPLAILFLFIDWNKYRNYLSLLRVGKVINLFSFILIFFNFDPGRVTETLNIKYVGAPVYYFYVIVGVIFFDLIFLVILLSYKLELKEKPPVVSVGNRTVMVPERGEDTLPDFSEVKVREKVDIEKSEE